MRRRGHDLEEDILKCLYQSERRERPVRADTVAAILGASAARVRDRLERMIAAGLIEDDGARLGLSERGRRQASHFVRGHRLLETYLSDRTGHSLARLHRLADRREHRLPAARIDELERSLGYPLRDPHGDRIPGTGDPAGESPPLPLRLFPAGSAVRVVHVEDEPEAPYRELLAAGIVPGSELEVLGNEAAGMELLVAGRGRCRLGPAAADQLDVAAGGNVELAALRGLAALSEVPLGHPARIVMLTGLLRGEERRRLLDLGFTPNTAVRPVLHNALGKDPRAYLIRNSKIALRREQARNILVVPEPESAEGPA